jgi:hypothetical protein
MEKDEDAVPIASINISHLWSASFVGASLYFKFYIPIFESKSIKNGSIWSDFDSKSLDFD